IADLRSGPQPAALRRRHDRGHEEQAGGEPLPIRHTHRVHHHQPAVPEAASEQRTPKGKKTMTGDSFPLSRRLFLRGVGVTMALPWLESVPVWGAAAPGRSPPKRFAALFMGCGINGNHWWAKGAGADMQLGKSLEPLATLKTKINVVNGLFNRNATGVGIHP